MATTLGCLSLASALVLLALTLNRPGRLRPWAFAVWAFWAVGAAVNGTTVAGNGTQILWVLTAICVAVTTVLEWRARPAHTTSELEKPAMTETRTHLTYLYPGSFMPEESRTVRVDAATAEEALRNSPDDRWFAAEFSTQDWQRWTSDEGGEKWLPIHPRQAVKRRVYVGEEMNADQIAAFPGDFRTLLSNMAGNGWATVVQTRAGNFQPVEADDVVIPDPNAKED